MSKSKIKVSVIGFDSLIEEMFIHHDKYQVMINDIHNEPDLVVFTGGADIDPQLYGEKRLPKTHISPERDRRDGIAWDRYGKKPKVGICRGGQYLNVRSGGSMWQHINNHEGSHHITNLLPIKGKYKMGDVLLMTSTHHQMMIPGYSGEVIGAAFGLENDSGISTVFESDNKQRKQPYYDTEVVWYEDTNSLCFQPHPEYTRGKDCDNYFFSLLDHFWFGG